MKADVFELVGENWRQLKKEQEQNWGDAFVYIWFHNNVCQYVGRSTRIYNRFQVHLVKHSFTEADRFRFIRCPSIDIAARLEHEFIRAYQPIMNKYGQ